jgi:hypothetical protein
MTQKSDWTFYALPTMTLVERSMINPESLTTDEYQQVMGFSAVYNCAQDYASADDKVAVDYVSKYYGYFCERYHSYSFLPEEAKPSFQVAAFSTSDSFIGQAYIIAGCAQDYFDL